MAIEIAQEASEIVLDPRKYLTMLYGEAGTGKTTFFSQTPGAYFIKTEDGTQGVKIFGHNVTTWEEALQSFNAILKMKDSGWKGVRKIETIIIDCYEKLWWMCGDYLCRTTRFLENGAPVKYDRIEDVTWGKGYNRTNGVVIGVLNKLMLLGFGVGLISHVREKIKTYAGKDLTSVGPNLSGSAADAIVDECGAVGYCCIEEKVQRDANGNLLLHEQGRYIYWQPTFLRVAKHRLRRFPAKMPLRYGTGWADYEKVFQAVAANVEQNIDAELDVERILNA